MTRTRRTRAAALSANDAFKLQYPKYLKRSTLAALALTALVAWLWPGYRPQPYKLREKEEMVWVDVAPPVEVRNRPEVKPAPVIPPVIEVGDPDTDDLGEPDWSSRLLDVPVPGPAPIFPDDTGFVASSALPVLEYQARADYPEIARRSGLEGTVVVSALVGSEGLVEEATVIQGVHPILDRAAVAAALKCRFEPARQREIKVPARVAIPYRFKLR